MPRPLPRCATMILIAALSLAGAATVQELMEDGPWALQVGPTGPKAVTYEGEPLLRIEDLVVTLVTRRGDQEIVHGIAGTAAHEIGHIVHWDFVVMTLAAAVPMPRHRGRSCA